MCSPFLQTASPVVKEISRLAANKDAMDYIEKQYRIFFPLDQISAPVMTHLVTDYDLSPNLLRADIDAKNGGWLVVGLTGDEARVDDALVWLREQGLEVTNEN